MRILVVDDVGAMRKIIRHALEKAGYTDIVEAANGTEAMTRLKAVNLILTDIYMPGMGGFSLVRGIRQISSMDKVPIIAVTAENRTALIQRLLRYGVNDYIVKPFINEALIEKVKAFEDEMDEEIREEQHVTLADQLDD
ncbi:response regulator [bacterium]|nr:response regulator [bacterium]